MRPNKGCIFYVEKQMDWEMYIPPTGRGRFWGTLGIEIDILQPNGSPNGQTPDVYGLEQVEQGLGINKLLQLRL